MATALYGPAAVAPPQNKITKARAGKMAVKPILKKLSHSEKNSLDLDRGWDDQQSMSPQPWSPGGASIYEPASAARSARDVTFSAVDYSPTAATAGAGAGASKTARFTHVRSPSGASVATSGSGGLRAAAAAGSFVHPFQQTPRTSTPPLSYATSFDNGRDYSPTITENEDDDDDGDQPRAHHHHHHHHAFHYHAHSVHSASTSNLRRPSLASQRTASFSDITTAPASVAAPPLRVSTARSLQSPSRLAHGSLTRACRTRTCTSTRPPPAASSPPTRRGRPPRRRCSRRRRPPPPLLASPSPSPASAAAPISPPAQLLEGVGYRLRSRSEVDAGARAENIREARRRFEARERAKEEKHDREMLRKRERRDHREAKELERQPPPSWAQVQRRRHRRRQAVLLAQEHVVAHAHGRRRCRHGQGRVSRAVPPALLPIPRTTPSSSSGSSSIRSSIRSRRWARSCRSPS